MIRGTGNLREGISSRDQAQRIGKVHAQGVLRMFILS